MIADDVRLLIAQVASLVALVIATIDYGAVVRRRAWRRRRDAELLAAQETGLQGLVRVLIVDR
jgi:hypothetical protein